MNEEYTRGYDDAYNFFKNRLATVLAPEYRHIAPCKDGKLCPSSIALRATLLAFGIPELTLHEIYKLHSTPQPAHLSPALNVQAEAIEPGPRRRRYKY